MTPPAFDSLTNQSVARHYTDYAIPTHNTIHKRGQRINSNLLYRFKAESCGLNISATCEHGNEMSGRFLFYLENAQLLYKDSVRWRQLVNNGLLVEVLFTPLIQKVGVVTQVSLFYFSVTMTYCFTCCLQI